MAAHKKNVKKAQYYVLYLGWKECRGVAGREFTEPIVKDLLRKRSTEYLPKLSLEVSKKEIKIAAFVDKHQKSKAKDKHKYPPIPAKDVTYAVQALYPDEDVVACIYLGYNPRTQSAVHVHIYKCDSVATAASLVEHINQIISIPEHQKRVAKIESELVNKGQIAGRSVVENGSHSDPGSDKNSDGAPERREIRLPRVPVLYDNPPSPPYLLPQSRSTNEQYSEPPSDYPVDPEALKEEQDRQVYQSLAEEFKQKLQQKENQKLLVPPKDYDTVRVTKDYEDRRWKAFEPPSNTSTSPHHSRGNSLDDSGRGRSEDRKWGENPVSPRLGHHSRGNSYDDSGRTESEGSQISSGFSQTEYNQAVDAQVMSQFEIRGPAASKPINNYRDVEEPVRNYRDVEEPVRNYRDAEEPVRNKRDSDPAPKDNEKVAQPAWVGNLFNNTNQRAPKLGYESRNENGYGRGSPQHSRGNSFDDNRREPASPRTMERPMSPMPMVPYDEWAATPSGPDYLSNKQDLSQSPVSPASPHGQYRPYDMSPRDLHPSYAGGDPYVPQQQARNKKYTPTSLGLAEPEPRFNRHPDEGYRSMDPRDYGGGYSMDRAYPVSPRGYDPYSPENGYSASLEKDKKKKNRKW